LSLIITPITYVGIIYFTKLYFQRAESSGIPQVIATLDSRNKKIRQQLLSLKAALAKISIIFLGMLGGATDRHSGAKYLYWKFYFLASDNNLDTLIFLIGITNLPFLFK
jgi:hypothetical protein